MIRMFVMVRGRTGLDPVCVEVACLQQKRALVLTAAALQIKYLSCLLHCRPRVAQFTSHGSSGWIIGILGEGLTH